MFGGESVGRVQLYDRNFKLKEQISESEEAPIKQGAQPHLVDSKNRVFTVSAKSGKERVYMLDGREWALI